MQNLTHDVLESYLKRGLVRKQTQGELSIFNYTESCQFSRQWDEVTLQCRGLILDEQSRIVARPFNKFFNLGEPSCPKLPELPYAVFDKLDGSLIIAYWWNSRWNVATRGSFNNEYTEYAASLLYDLADLLPLDLTHLFEVVLPPELDGLPRVVKHQPGLYYLGARAVRSGEDLCPTTLYPYWKSPLRAEEHATISVAELLARAETLTGAEGYVVRFENGFRVKIKGAWYLRLFRAVTQMSEKRIRELWAESPDACSDAIIAQFPEEFREEIAAIVTGILHSLVLRLDAINGAFSHYNKNLTRKEFALAVKDHPDKYYLFQLLDNKDITKQLLLEERGGVDASNNETKSDVHIRTNIRTLD